MAQDFLAYTLAPDQHHVGAARGQAPADIAAYAARSHHGYACHAPSSAIDARAAAIVHAAAVTAAANGETEYRFDQIRAEFQGAEEVRRALALESREVGEIVYSSADTPVESSERDARLFDRELARAGAEALPGPGRALGRYLPSADRVAYVDDFELVAFDEELKNRAAVRR